MDDTITAAPSQHDPNTFLVTSAAQIRNDTAVCPNAQSLVAYCPDFHADVLISLNCKQWSCRTCAENKIRRLSALTRDAKPNRLLTLTVDPARWETPRHAFDGTRRQIPTLFAGLRKRFGDIQYLRVTELTKKGWPHYHFLLRSNFLPQPVVRNAWQELTGATIVDLRQVKQSFRAYGYLVKYLSKLHKIEWTERHVSYSRTFFKEPVTPKATGLNLLEATLLEQHPSSFLAEHYAGERITQVSNTMFQLPTGPKTPEEF